MAPKDFKLKWAHGICRSYPTYISNDKIFIAYDSFVKICSVSNNIHCTSINPGFPIGCTTSSPTVGVIAVTERKDGSPIHILSYPRMEIVSTIHQMNSGKYFALQFIALELLVSIQVHSCYEITLWRWTTGDRMDCFTQKLVDRETPEVKLTVNPMRWYHMVLQSNLRFVFIEVKFEDDKYFFYPDSFSVLEEASVTAFRLSRVGEDSFVDRTASVVDLICHCWIPGDKILVATSNGCILIIHYLNRDVSVLSKLSESKAAVTSMAFNKCELFVSYINGHVDIVDICRGDWTVKTTLDVKYTILNLLFSPHFDFLTISTLKGSIYSLKKTNFGYSLDVVAESHSLEVNLACFFGPFSHYCMTVDKIGGYVYRSKDGKCIGSINLDEEIVCLAASPLCSYAVLGSIAGFLYFIDLTVPDTPRIIECFRPYDTPVEIMRIDNYGQFIIASSEMQSVEIWNALPTSNFRFLGSQEIQTKVKDVAIFRRSKEDDTFLFILSEMSPSSEAGTGNILIQLKLPKDLITDPKKYQIDDFGTIKEDAMRHQMWIFDNPCCKICVHWIEGVLFYSPFLSEIEKFSVWSNATSVESKDIHNINISSLRVSPNQQWLGAIDVKGYLQLYDLSNLSEPALLEKHGASEIIKRSLLDFSVHSNALLIVKDNREMMYYEWLDDVSDSKMIPEWIVSCYYQNTIENDCLRRVDGGKTVDFTIEESQAYSICIRDLYHKIETCINTLNFYLNSLSDVVEVKTILNSNKLIINNETIQEIAQKNNKKISYIFCDIFNLHEKRNDGIENSKKDNDTISSFCLGFEVQKYFEELCVSNFDINQEMSFLADETKSKKSINNLFTEGNNFKTKKERLFIFQEIKKRGNSCKKEFNNHFDILFWEKEDILSRISEIYFKVHLATKNLPSKVETDFYDAYFGQRISDRISLEDWNKEANATLNAADPSKDSKKYIQNQMEFAQKIKREFDDKVEKLSLERMHTDFQLHLEELKIFCALIFTEVEDQFDKWELYAEEHQRYSKCLVGGLVETSKELAQLENDIRILFSNTQKMERDCNLEVKKECQKMENADIIYAHVSQQPIFNFSDGSFWTATRSIAVEHARWLNIINAEVLSCPENVSNAAWNNILKRRSRCLTLDVILRNIEELSIDVSLDKQKCEEAMFEVKHYQQLSSRITDDESKLVMTFKENICELLCTELESSNISADGNVGKAMPWESQGASHKFWERLNQVAHRNWTTQMRLEGVEGFIDSLRKLNLAFNEKLCNVHEMCSSLLQTIRNNIRSHRDSLAAAQYYSKL